MIPARHSSGEALEVAVLRELEAGPASFGALARRLEAEGDARPLLAALEALARVGAVELDEAGDSIRARSA